MVRNTKILCTVGPSSEDRPMLRRMMKAGMDGVRINFSHGTHEEHGKVIQTVRQLSKEQRRPVAVVIDLQGPKSRIGTMEEGGVFLKPGHGVTITTKAIRGNAKHIPTTDRDFPSEVRTGDDILLSDGAMSLKVQRVEGENVEAIVVRGGILQSNKGMNYKVRSSKRGLTEKDWKDLQFGLDNEVDFVAISFVRSARDVSEVRKFVEKKGSDVHLIAKIEKPEAVERIDEILSVADGIMIARGDLGVEIPLEEMPRVQKDIIARCGQTSRIVITATQMLESMTWNPTPTRAEVLDIANAVLDGTDVLMLSGETAVGKYPVEVIKVMARVAERAERDIVWNPDIHRDLRENLRITNTVGHAATTIAHNLDAKLIVAFTMGGSTARVISKYRPSMPLMALSPNPNTVRRMALYRGVRPRTIERTKTTDEMIAVVERTIHKNRLLDKGELCVITAGVPLSTEGMSNLIKVHRVGTGRWEFLGKE
jgi:pyruvate kinase